MKVTVLGWYNHNNIGDESYKLAFPMIFPKCKFQFTNKLTSDIVKSTDIIVVGGGDILSDPFLNQVVGVKKPKYVISASATEKTDENKLKDFKSITVRDSKSVKILKDKGLKVNYAPDIAHILKPNPSNGLEILRKKFEQQELELYDRIVVVVMNGYLVDSESNHYDVRKFLSFHDLAFNLGHISDWTNASFIFLPFGQSLPWDDRVANAWVSQRCKFWKKNMVIWEEPNVQNVLDIISAAGAVISTRLHSTIFSIAAGVPFIDIIHNHKNESLIETIDMQEYAFPYSAIDRDAILNLLRRMLDYPESYKKEMKNLIDNQRALLGGISDVRQLR
jgi:polysaccharide pyruvyl transferase WcaK-like protein